MFWFLCLINNYCYLFEVILSFVKYLIRDLVFIWFCISSGCNCELGKRLGNDYISQKVCSLLFDPVKAVNSGIKGWSTICFTLYFSSCWNLGIKCSDGMNVKTSKLLTSFVKRSEIQMCLRPLININKASLCLSLILEYLIVLTVHYMVF